ncbi:hypothetical protein M758_UG265000 [Ceratodon purpureus]|nr:hypothetical protein M758_UG265000 [Ceratodon purpureus]
MIKQSCKISSLPSILPARFRNTTLHLRDWRVGQRNMTYCPYWLRRGKQMTAGANYFTL